MKKEITLEQIKMLTENADYFQVEKAINNLLKQPKIVTLGKDKKDDTLLPMFRKSFSPHVDGLGSVCGTVYPPRLCPSTEPGFPYELEFIQCSLDSLEENVKLKNLHYSFYDLGLELRCYNKWHSEIIIVPFKNPKDELMFWVLKTISTSSLHSGYSPNLDLYNLKDVKSVFSYNNDYIHFVFSKNKPQINSLEYKYIQEIKSSYKKINERIGGLFEEGFFVEYLLNFISLQKDPNKIVDGLVYDSGNKNLANLCNLIIDDRKKAIEKSLTYRSSSGYSSGGIH